MLPAGLARIRPALPRPQAPAHRLAPPLTPPWLARACSVLPFFPFLSSSSLPRPALLFRLVSAETLGGAPSLPTDRLQPRRPGKPLPIPDPPLPTQVPAAPADAGPRASSRPPSQELREVSTPV